MWQYLAIISFGDRKKMSLYLRLRMLMFTAFFQTVDLSSQEFRSCLNNSDCPKYLAAYVCCDHYCIWGSDCYGELCTSNSDCKGLYCCYGLCRYTCEGEFCDSETDCGGPNAENCCSNTCQTGTCPLTDWAIVLIVLASVVAFPIVLWVMWRCCCSYCESNPGDVIVNPPINPAPFAGSTVNYGTVYPIPSAPPPPYSEKPTPRSI